MAKFNDTKFAKIEPHLSRFQQIKETPGPTNYKGEGDGVSSSGKYILSNHKGAGTRAFSQTSRKIFTDDVSKSVKNLPGPGNYESPSDFGVYGDAHYYKRKRYD